MSFNPLSLSHPDSIVEVVDLTLSPHTPDYAPHTPDYAPHTPDHAPPGYIHVPINTNPRISSHRVRGPRRCSCCRQTGHDARTCPDAYGVHYRGQMFNMYANPRDNLTQFVFSRVIQQAPVLNGFPRLTQRLFEDILFHVQDLSYRELKAALKNPASTLNFAYSQLFHRVEDLRLNRGTITLGKDFAKKIVIDMQVSDQEASECVICCDKLCSVKTSCGHEFCVDCVIQIVSVNNAKTTPAVCSFCKAHFTLFTANSSLSHVTLCDFIQNL